MTRHSLWVVIHDHVTPSDPGRNLSMRDQEFVEEATIADDEVAALQDRKRRLLRVDHERRPTPLRRQEPTRPPEIVDVPIARKDWHHQRKCDGPTLKERFIVSRSDMNSNHLYPKVAPIAGNLSCLCLT